MSQFFKIHPNDPQLRLIRQAVEIIISGGIIVYPTDSGYALGCHLGDKQALTRISKIRQLDKHHNFTLICRNLSEISRYACFDTPVFRKIKANTPGPYTFILKATKEVPSRLMHPKKKTIGIRIPDNNIAQHLLAELNEPLMTTTLIFPDETLPANDPEKIREQLQKQIQLVIDGGCCGFEFTTIVDLIDNKPVILRQGKGDIRPFI